MIQTAQTVQTWWHGPKLLVPASADTAVFDANLLAQLSSTSFVPGTRADGFGRGTIPTTNRRLACSRPWCRVLRSHGRGYDCGLREKASLGGAPRPVLLTWRESHSLWVR